MAFKINTLAKDLGMKSKELTELLAARGIEGKSTQSALDPHEFDVVFEALTRAKQVSNIDDYLFGDTYIPTAAPEKKEAKKPKAEQPKEAEAVKETPAAPAPKAEAKEEAKKPAPAKAEATPAPEKTEPEVKSAPTKEAVAAPSAPAKEARPAPSVRTYNIPQNLRATMQRPAAPAARPQGPRVQGAAPQGPRTAGAAPAQGTRPQGAAPAFANRTPAADRFANRPAPSFGNDRFGGNARPAQKPQQSRGGQGGFRDKDEGGRAPREHFQAQAIVRGQTPKGGDTAPKTRGQTRVVDMRGNSVDLSKYDERLDTFVPDAVRDARGGNQRVKKQHVGTHAMTAG